MNVLALVRKEFNVDDQRIYLMGHSQGGGGARHLAEKYSDTWAAVALLAPALFNVQVTAESKITKVPMLLAVGDQDSLITSARSFSAQLKGLNVAHEYIENAGAGSRHDHHGQHAQRVPLLSETREAGAALTRPRAGAKRRTSRWCGVCPVRLRIDVISASDAERIDASAPPSSRHHRHP